MKTTTITVRTTADEKEGIKEDAKKQRPTMTMSSYLLTLYYRAKNIRK
jgi:hypothetical protein